MPILARALPALLALGLPGTPALPPSPLNASQKACHLLNRLAYGPRPGEVERLARGGDAALLDWLRHQMEPAGIPDEAVEARVKAYPTLGQDLPALQAAFRRPRLEAKEAGLRPEDPEYKAKLRELVPPEMRPGVMEEELVSAKLVRAVESERQLQEVLADFWFNHFNVFLNKGADRWFIMTYEREALRRHLFGKFRDLVLATAGHPAMLWYLDNWLSAREGFDPAALRPPQRPRPVPGAPKLGLNENYARELMELHTLGVDGGYTQADVREVARCFTGWSIERPREAARAVFRRAAHDASPKTVLGARIDEGGSGDGEQVIALLCRQPACATLVATKLCRRFVGDQPPPALVRRVAKRFLDTDGDLRQVYWALFTSPEFWSREALHTKVKTPYEFAVSSVRALGGRLDKPVPLARAIARMGQPLYRCQPPTGYKEVQEAWVNTGALVNRIRFGMALAQGRLAGVSWSRPAFEEPLQREPEPAAALPRLASLLLQEELGPGGRGCLSKGFRPAEAAPPEGGARTGPPLDRALGLLLGSPEFQRK